MAAIQFPPVLPGDPEPVDGETYIYLPTKEEYVCSRASPADTAQWTQQGVISSTAFAYQGLADLSDPAPGTAKTGYIYSSETTVTAANIDASWVGLAGATDVQQYDLVIYSNPTWTLINTGSSSNPWVRSVGGVISPAVPTDDLNMNQGDYQINTLTDLP